MKKIALLIMFMIIFTLASFAQVDVSVSGSSELTLGIALDDPVASGFTNNNESEISFTLVSGDSEKGGEADVSGYIKIGGWSASADSEDDWDIDAGDVTAKIMFPGGWVKITGTNSSCNFVNPVEDNDGDDDSDDEGLTTSVDNSGGLVVGLDMAPAAIEIGLFSENDWTQDDEGTAAGDAAWGWYDNDENEETAPVWAEVPGDAAVDPEDDINDEHAYGASLKVTLDVAPVTVEIAALMGLNYESSPIGIGGKVTADVAPATIYAAADMQVPAAEGADMLMEFGAGVSVAIMDGVSAALDFSFNDPENPVSDHPDDMDVELSVTEDGAGGAVPDLGASLTVQLFNLMADDIVWNVDVTLDYTTPMVKPYAGFGMGSDEVIDINVGAEIYAIEMVTLTLDYATDNIDTSNGTIKFITKISY